MAGAAKRDNRHAVTLKGPKAPVPKFVDREGPVHIQLEVDLWSPRPDPAAAADERPDGQSS